MLAEPLIGGQLAEPVQGPADGLAAGVGDARSDQGVHRFQAGRAQAGELEDVLAERFPLVVR
jgi:hypothetical protein